jgi:hypothetical protein
VAKADPGKPVAEASSTWGGAGGPGLLKTAGGGAWDTAVRGYQTEMEHFAYCVRAWQDRKEKVSYEKDPATGKLKHADILPRCHGEIAMADAILALTANMAMDRRTRIEFDPKWFDAKADDVPETRYGRSQA